MRNFIFMLMTMLMFPMVASAEVVGEAASGTTIDVATFVGLYGLVGLIVTQIAKLVPAINEKKWAKVLVALAVGIVAAMVCWAFKASDFMLAFTWWQALLTGIAAGLSSMGFYDIIKAVASLFKKS